DKHDYDRAAIEYLNAARLAPKDPEPYYRIGLAYLANNDADRAAVAFLRAASLDPKHEGAQLNLAGILNGSNDKEALEDAVARLKALLDGGVRSAEILSTLAFTNMRLGNSDEAEELLRQSLNEFPQYLQSYVMDAKAKIARRDIGGAEQV